jgi:hypothetical protein
LHRPQRCQNELRDSILATPSALENKAPMLVESRVNAIADHEAIEHFPGSIFFASRHMVVFGL